MREKDSKKIVSFQLNDLRASRVFLAGSFNAWDPSSEPLRKDGEGRWETMIALECGVYQYRFIVDGEWRQDPSFRNNQIDGSVAFNSVIVV